MAEVIDRPKDCLVDAVYSPDDGGWYLQKTDFATGRNRVSKKVYSTMIAAYAAYKSGKVRWEQ